MKKTIVLLLALFLTVSCADKPQVKNYYEEEISYVFTKFIEKDDKFLFRLKLNHPLRITQKEMDRIMMSLKYQPNDSIWDFNYFSNHNGDVFDVQTIIEVAPQFRRKLSELQPEEKLVFAIVDQQEKTSGEVFIIGNGMHWRFDYIKGSSYIEKQKKILDWVAPWTEEDENFAMTLQEGQWFHITQKEMPRPGNRNWIILPIKDKALTKKDDVLVDYTVRNSLETDQEGTRRIISNRLMMLQKQFEGGVISADEYKKKREELLDTM